MAGRCAFVVATRKRCVCGLRGADWISRAPALSHQCVVGRAQRPRARGVSHRSAAGAAMSKSAGFTLVEVLVSVAISCTIFTAVLAMYAQTRATYRANERIARLQEQGRFALAMIEPDVALAGYYGFSNVPSVAVAPSIAA